MRFVAPILLLACAATAAAAAAECGRGREPVPRAELDSLTQLGTNAFTTHAHDELCDEYPLFITSGGLREYGVGTLGAWPPPLPPGLVPAKPARCLPPQHLLFGLWHS